jgi:hypothetical protein
MLTSLVEICVNQRSKLIKAAESCAPAKDVPSYNGNPYIVSHIASKIRYIIEMYQDFSIVTLSLTI